VIQVKTGREKVFINQFLRTIEHGSLRLLNPRRELIQWKDGKSFHIIKPLFPGYLFLVTEHIDAELVRNVKRLPDFNQFLRNNRDIKPLLVEDSECLYSFLNEGEIAGISDAYFDEHDRIVIISGPLQGLDGRIVKVNRRRGRAKVRFSLYENNLLVDFSFKDINRIKSD
jgi:transcription termination/antitermination protein NusG